MALNKYQRGETVIMRVETRVAGVLTNPGSGVKVTLTDSAGTAILTAQPMTNDSTGKYSYDTTLGVAAPVGWWATRYLAQDGSRYTVQDDGFEVEE